MIGNLLEKARIEQGLTKSDLSKLTGITIGHISHIEKGERIPSIKTVKTLCTAMNIPYQPMLYTYDKVLTDEQESFNTIKYISYNKILAIDSTSKFIECPANIPNSSIAFKITDDSMQNTFKKNSYVFIELNSPLDNKDYGLFNYNGELIIRKFYGRKTKITLKADNKNYPDINILNNSNYDFSIIGKVYKSTTK